MHAARATRGGCSTTAVITAVSMVCLLPAGCSLVMVASAAGAVVVVDDFSFDVALSAALRLCAFRRWDAVGLGLPASATWAFAGAHCW